jgi:hypothetical protein
MGEGGEGSCEDGGRRWCRAGYTWEIILPRGKGSAEQKFTREDGLDCFIGLFV